MVALKLRWEWGLRESWGGGWSGLKDHVVHTLDWRSRNEAPNSWNRSPLFEAKYFCIMWGDMVPGCSLLLY